MPKRTDITKFPTVFERIIRRAVAALPHTRPADPALFRVELRQTGEAMNLQLQLRQYLALLASMHASGRINDFPHLADIAARADSLAIRFGQGSRTVVEIIHRNQATVARAIAAALGELETDLDTLDGADPAAAGGAPDPRPTPEAQQERALATLYPGIVPPPPPKAE